MKKTAKRLVSLMVALALVLVQAPALVYAQEGETVDTGSCSHVHDDACGYVQGTDCTHACDEACEESCTHTVHDEDCGYTEGADCTHTHDDTCGGLAAEPAGGGTGTPAFVAAQANGLPKITYINENGSTAEVDATPITDGMTELTAGWYYVDGTVNLIQELKINGDVKIILVDGCRLTAERSAGGGHGIDVLGNTLSIYAQSTEGGVGKITAKGAEDYAGIACESGGTLNIYSGTVTATGGGYGAGIACESGGTLDIYGGTVTATGGQNSAGIGGGFQGAGGNTTISGGTVTATGGGDVTITGGRVTATSGGHGAGIGGGRGGAGGTVKITGGTVTATGDYGGAGIGGGYGGSGSAGSAGGNTTITGGSVKAKPDRYDIQSQPTNGKDNVYLGKLENQAGVTAVSVGGESYWIDSNHPEDDSLYLYMPYVAESIESHDVDVRTGEDSIKRYTATWDSVNSKFTFDDGQGQGAADETTVTVELSPDSVTYGDGTESITVTATLAEPAAGRRATARALPQMDSVSFYLGESPAPFAANIALKSGKATASLDIAGLDAGTYTITATYGGKYPKKPSTGTTNLTIESANQDAPTDLSVTHATSAGNDGKIFGVKDTMEYKMQGAAAYTSVSAGTTVITGLAPGIYLVRYKKTQNYNTSNDTELVVGPLSAAPTQLAFGSVLVGTAATKTITVTGTDLVENISHILSGDKAFSVVKASDWDDKTGGILEITFAPTKAKNYSATLTISAKGAADVTVTLTGTGHSYGNDSSDPAPATQKRSSSRGSAVYTASSGHVWAPPAAPPATYTVDGQEMRNLIAISKANNWDFVRSTASLPTTVTAEAWQLLRNQPFVARTVEDKAVQVQLTFSSPARITADLPVSGYVSGKTVSSRKAFFERWFANSLRIVQLEHSGSFGQSVAVAAKVDLTGMDTENLVFYSYDKTSNTYRLIETPAYRIDKNGYLHFTTAYGGTIVISEGPLAKK